MNEKRILLISYRRINMIQFNALRLIDAVYDSIMIMSKP